MLSRLPQDDLDAVTRIELPWYGRVAAPTVLPVAETGSDEDAYLALLGRTLQRIRKRFLKINQTALADRVGVDLTTISRWENGKTSLSAYDLTRLWRGLRRKEDDEPVPADWLLNPTDSMTELDRRIGQLSRVAAEAARAEAEAEQARRVGGGPRAQRGRPRA
jgi:transcriptional regulator with XRE-family HTH domain